MVYLGISDTQEIHVSDTARRSGLYILGKPGMGKSVLLANLINQNINDGQGVFFLDPHGDTIDGIIAATDPRRIESDLIILYAELDLATFGINLLACRDIASPKDRRDAYTRTYQIFQKLWEASWGLYLQETLQKVIPVFIENSEYAFTEIPLFLTNSDFRAHLVSAMRYDTLTRHYWLSEFKSKSVKEQHEIVQPLLTRTRTLLGLDLIRHLLGQKKTTIDFYESMQRNKILFVKLSAHLPADMKRFLGTIIVSELLHAVQRRIEIPDRERNHFNIYIDEFQHFAYSQDIQVLYTEARKWKIAACVAHQDRYGQFADNQAIIGATAAAANKILFQLTGRDAQEFAPEFAGKGEVTDTREFPRLIISKQPIWDLLTIGHANPRVQELGFMLFQPLQDAIRQIKQEAEETKLVRMSFMDDATISRDIASIYGVANQEAGMFARRFNADRSPILAAMATALSNTMSAHGAAREEVEQLKRLYRLTIHYQNLFRDLNEGLTAIMEGRLAPGMGNDDFAELLCSMIEKVLVTNASTRDVQTFVIRLVFGDRNKPLSLPGDVAVRYRPKELEALFLQSRQTEYDKYERKEIAYIEDHEKWRRETPREHWAFVWGVSKQDDLDKLAKKIAKMKEEDRETVRTGIQLVKIWTNSYPALKIEKHPFKRPDLPPQTYTEEEQLEILQECFFILYKKCDFRAFFTALEEAKELVKLLTDPENHIKVASRQYVEKPLHIRSISDMVNEMRQELTDLPPFNAYAKLLQDDGTILKQRFLTTSPLTPPEQELAWHRQTRAYRLAEARSLASHYQARHDIETQITERWQDWQKEAPEAPPPSW